MTIPLKTGGTTPSPVSSSPPLIPSLEALNQFSEVLHNTMVVYGPTGTRKTTQIGEFAKYIYAKTGKKTRLLSADGGGWGPIQNLVNAEIIEPWRVVEEANPKVALIKASKGAWPDQLKNGIRMSKFVTQPLTTEAKVTALKDVGAYAVEGWASIAQLLMGDLVAKGQKISEDIVGKFEESADFGSESFGAPGRSHYGFVQNFILSMIRNFGGLPVERILYSSLEGKGEDSISKVLQYGPLISGKALTASIPTYVGDCLHFEDFTEPVGVDPANPSQKLFESKVRVWFTQHPDVQSGVMWPAKPRIVGDKYEQFKQTVGPNGYFILGPTANLGTYLAAQDEILETASADARAWKEMIDKKRAAVESNPSSPASN